MAQPPTTPKQAKLPATQSTPISQSDSGTESYTHTHHSVDEGLKIEWERNSANGVDFQEMLRTLFPKSPDQMLEHNKFKEHEVPIMSEWKASLIEALEKSTELDRYKLFTKVANDILQNWYENHAQTSGTPPIVFVPLGKRGMRGSTRQKPDVVILWREPWQNLLKQKIEDSNQPVDFKEAKKSCYDITEDDLCTLQIDPPWDLTIAVLEFKTKGDRQNTPNTSAFPIKNTSVSGSKRSFYQAGLDTPETRPAKRARISASSSKASLGTSDSVSFHAPHAAQLLNYFGEMISSSSYRDWVSGARIIGHEFSLLSCDREGAIVSRTIDLQDQAGFLSFVDWVITLGTRTATQWGYSDLFGEPASDPSVKRVLTILSDSSDDGPLELQLKSILHQQYGVFGRGTTVFKTTFLKDGKTRPAVCKISWQPKTRAKEWVLIEAARQINTENTPEVLAFHEWDRPLPSRKLQPLSQRKEAFELQVMRVVVMPQYEPLYKLEGEEFLDAFKQIMECDVQLFNAEKNGVKTGVHHRDLSIMNMMYRKAEGKTTGILIDFDLAVLLGAQSNTASSERRIGTAPFMAISLQDPVEDSKQTLEHDFESAIYILVWVGVGYKGWQPPPNDPLEKLRHGTWRDIANYKRAFLYEPRRVLKHITDDYKLLRDPIKRLSDKLRVSPDQILTFEEFVQCFESTDTATVESSHNPAIAPPTSV